MPQGPPAERLLRSRQGDRFALRPGGGKGQKWRFFADPSPYLSSSPERGKAGVRGRALPAYTACDLLSPDVGVLLWQLPFAYGKQRGSATGKIQSLLPT